MLIYPQILSPKFFITTVAISVLAVIGVSYLGHKNLKESREEMAHEKSLVINELSEMIVSYDKVNIENDSIKLKLNLSKQKIVNLLDSIKVLKPSVLLASKFKAQLNILRLENVKTLSMVSALEVENLKLLERAKIIEDSLFVKDSLGKVLELKNKSLYSLNHNLNKDLIEAKKLAITSIEAEGVKRITSKNKIRDTRLASKTKKFHVRFKLLKNNLIAKGKKEFYFQVLNSKMRVVSKKGEVDFGRTSLIYSGKKTLDYNNEDLDVSVFIDKGEEEKIDKGVYHVSIYYQGIKLGRTSIELK